MSEFTDLQSRIQQATVSAEAARQQLFLAREKLRALRVASAQVARSAGTRSDAYGALLREQQEAERAIAWAGSRLTETVFDRAAALDAFLPFTDPRESLGRLPATDPILLFPVRLETRFKVLQGRDGRTRHQLWVRIFPDDCSIDSFDEVLSASEVARARNYWTEAWKAGAAANQDMQSFVRNKQKGAWRKLMGTFNSGRAYWITGQYRPVNESEVPQRGKASDRILVIPTDTPPDAPTQAALSAYWTAILRAGSDQPQVDAALAALTAATGGGEDAARTLVATYRPQNLEEPPDEVVDDPAVRVAFLVFDGTVDAKATAWSRAAAVRTFPERFVLLGFQDNHAEPVINELGAAIPNPIMVGPDTREDIESVLLEEYGPEFADLPEEEKATRYVEYLARRSETRWLFDFDQAVAMGLGFRVDLTPAQARQGFTRLLVLGIRLGADSQAGQASLEQLLQHHQFGDVGFALLAQGTPTNNTEEAPAGQSVLEDADEAFERYFPLVAPEDPTEPRLQRDGRRLAELLGIDVAAAALPTAQNYFGRDQLEARAMHAALWNATLGFFFESMAPPLLSETGRSLLRRHLLDHVKGRGAVPAIRIGSQPYGILPISDLRNLEWLTPPTAVGTAAAVSDDASRFLRGLYAVLKVMRADWESVVGKVGRVGQGEDAHAVLLSVLGLHADSVEFDRRVAESFDQIKNALYAQGVLGDEIDNLDAIYRARGMQLLAHLGFVPDPDTQPVLPILTRSFLGQQEDVTKDLIDDTPLSEVRPIRAYTDEGENYIQWLLENATADHGRIRREEGFSGGKPPAAVLYDLLRHALNLEFGNAGIRLHQRVGILSQPEAEATRVDPEFIGVQVGNKLAESRWDIIYRQEPLIAPQGMVVDHIVSLLRAAVADDATSRLQEVLDALEVLKDTPTARLERCLVEHLDCCHYRLDAWLLSLLDTHLRALRSAGANQEGPKRGIYLGAYGWVEDLKADERMLSPAVLDEVQRATFDPQNERRIVSDSENGGYIHAPSTPHALTAAVLRNAYISAATPEESELYKVNLSSERVRLALSVIEGMQQGQGLAELLGYRLERGLHDNNAEELDIFIYELRKVFPLVSNRLKRTAIRAGRVALTPLEAVRFAEEAGELEGDKAVTKLEARNVVDGLALLDHIKQTGEASYPFGFPTGTGVGQLRAATEGERAAIDAEVSRLMNVRDAVADLALAESVHQVVQGNYDRAAGALDAYSKGGFPQLPDVIQSPESGRTLTHRFAIHLQAGVAPAVGRTPRARAEPALSAWLRELFPTPDRIACTLRFRVPVAEGEPPNPWSDLRITLEDLALEPVDLLYLHEAESEKTFGALDDHVLRFFHRVPRRPDLEVQVSYTTADPGDATLFELGALLAELRTLVLAARPLEASDIALQNEGSKLQNADAEVDPARITAAKIMYDAALGSLQAAVIDSFEPLVDFEDMTVGMGNLAAIVAAIDAGSDAFLQHMGSLSLFGMTGAGSAYVHDRRRSIHAAIRNKVESFHQRWTGFAARYEDLLDVDLPGAATEEERIAVLQKAEALISASFTTAFADAAALEISVRAKKGLFDARHAQLTGFLASEFATLAAQHAAAVTLVAGLEAFDQQPMSIEEEDRQYVVLAEDMLKQAQQLHALGHTHSAAVQDLLGGASSATAADRLAAMKQAAAHLFGDGFRLLPEFRLSPDRALELQNCMAAVDQLLDYQTATLERDFPVDEWLYGVARVREKLGAWENLVMLAEGLRERPAMELTPFQLPYRDDDSWLALEYPSSHVVEGDTMLYTAYAPGLDPAGPLVGVLVDEWTETIPVRQETTGLTFHYDRPNCEAPQSLLLVTPASASRAWTWSEVVAALHEALDLARLRAVEPDQLDELDYARFLPATIATLTYTPVTMALNFAAVATAPVHHG